MVPGLSLPLTSSHALFLLNLASDSEIFVVDPTLREEQVREGDMTLTINQHKEICALSKAGGAPLEFDTVVHCARIATVRVLEITKRIEQALIDDQELRFGGLSHPSRQVMVMNLIMLCLALTGNEQ